MPATLVQPAASGGRTPSVGALLWAWNRQDVSQFDVPVDHQRDIGAVAGSISASFVADVFRGRPGFRVTGAAIQGGHVLPVKASEVTLPDRYIVEARIARIASTFSPARVYPFFKHDAGVFRGFAFHRANGSSASSYVCVRNDLSNLSTSGPASAVWNATMEQQGGVHILLEVHRQNGADPAEFLVNGKLEDFQTIGRAGVNEGTMSVADWNTHDMTRFGVGLYYGGGGTDAGEADFLDLAVYAHPLD